MSDSHCPGYPVLNHIDFFLHTYMVVFFLFEIGVVVVTVIIILPL